MGTITVQNDVEVLVDRLQTLQTKLQKLKRPADALTRVVDEIDTALAKPQELVKALDRLRELLNAIAVALDAVSAPLEELGIGEALDAIGEVLETARPAIGDVDKILDETIKSTIGPLQGPVKKLKSPTDAVDRLVDNLTADVQKWVPTVEFISEGIDLADAISNLIGGKFAEDIQKIADIYNEGAKDISEVLAVLDRALDDIDDLITKMKTFFDDIKSPFDELAGIADTVTTGLTPFSALDSMLEAIENVIKPVKWALDAVQKVFDKIVAPILEPFLKPLEALVRRIVNKGLHLDVIKQHIQRVENQLGLGDILQNTKAFFDKVTHLDELQKTIEEKLDTFAAPSLQAQIENLLKKLEAELQSSAVAARVRLERAGPSPSGDSLQALVDLQGQLESIPATIKKMQRPAASLTRLIQSAETVRAAPTDLERDLAVFDPMLVEVTEMLQFLDTFPLLKEFLPGITETLSDFQQPVSHLAGTVETLLVSVKTADQAFDTLMDPLNDVGQGLGGLKEDVKGWNRNLTSMYHEIQLAHAEDAKCQNQFEARIKALEDQINQACTEVTPTVDSLVSTLEAIGGSGGSITGVTAFLNTYQNQLTAISTSATDVNKTLTVLERAKPRVDQAYSVMRPLQWLIHAACNPGGGGGAVNAGEAPSAWQKFERGLEKALSGVETLLQSVVNHVFRVRELDSTMQQVVQTLDQSSAGWKNSTGKLQSELASLASGKENVTVGFDALFSGDYQTKLSQLEKDMVAAIHGKS